jgi:hypothetical protein
MHKSASSRALSVLLALPLVPFVLWTNPIRTYGVTFDSVSTSFGTIACQSWIRIRSRRTFCGSIRVAPRNPERWRLPDGRRERIDHAEGPANAERWLSATPWQEPRCRSSGPSCSPRLRCCRCPDDSATGLDVAVPGG